MGFIAARIISEEGKHRKNIPDEWALICEKKILLEMKETGLLECCFDNCNNEAVKSIGNNLTGNLHLCEVCFKLYNKHLDAREDNCREKGSKEERERILKLIREIDCDAYDNAIWLKYEIRNKLDCSHNASEKQEEEK